MKSRHSKQQPGLWRHLLIFFGLTSSLVLSLPPASASINTEREHLEQRVNAVRESLTANPAFQVGDRETRGADKLAQYWPNWGNFFNR